MKPKPGSHRRFWTAPKVFVGLGIVPLGLYGLVIVLSSLLVEREKAWLRERGFAATAQEIDRQLPAPPPAKNAWTHYARAIGNAYLDDDMLAYVPIIGVGEVVDSYGPLSSAMLKDSEKFIEQNWKAYSDLRTAVSLEVCRFPVNYGDPNLSVGHYSTMRQSARLFALDALVAANTANPRRVADDIVDGLKVGRHLSQEPLLIALLVKMATDQITLFQFDYAIQRGVLGDAELSVLQKEFARQESYFDMDHLLVGEVCWTHALFHTPDGDVPEIFVWSGRMAVRLGLGDVYRLDNFRALRLFLEIEADRPWEIRELANATDDFTSLTSPFGALGPVADLWLSHQAKFRLAQYATALERYFIKYGVYPENILPAVAEFLPQAPVSPYDGGAVHYESIDSGYIVSFAGDRSGLGSIDNLDSGRGFLNLWDSVAYKRVR